MSVVLLGVSLIGVLIVCGMGFECFLEDNLELIVWMFIDEFLMMINEYYLLVYEFLDYEIKIVEIFFD